MKRKKYVSLILLFAMFLSIMTPIFENIAIASERTDIIQNLSIKEKENEYRPGDEIIISGEWHLPNDTEDKKFKAGDTFVLEVSEGLIPKFKSINLDGYGRIESMGNSIILILTEKVEGRLDRYGGFNLKLQLDRVLKNNNKFPITIKEGKKVLFKDELNIKEWESSLQKTNEVLAKGYHISSGAVHDYSVPWFIRINYSGELKGNSISLEDRMPQNHIIDKDSMKIQLRYMNLEDQSNETKEVTGKDKQEIILSDEKTKNIIEVDDDLKGFKIKHLDIEDIQTGNKKIYKFYTILYETKVIDNKGEEGNKIPLENYVYLKTDKGEVAEASANYGFDSSGWGTSRNVKGSLKIIKINNHGEKLEGAEFLLRSDSGGKIWKAKTNEKGEALIENLPYGSYQLKETKAPIGYINKGDIETINLYFTKDNEVIEKEIINENEKKIDIKVKKTWDVISDSDKYNEVYLELMRKVEKETDDKYKSIGEITLNDNNNWEHTFSNKDKYNEDGKEYEYIIVEPGLAEDFEVEIKKVELDNEIKFEVINKLKKVEFTVEKIWQDKAGNTINPVEDICIKVLANGKYVASKELSKDKSSVKFDNLYFSDKDGEIVYSIEEFDKYGCKLLDSKYETNISGDKEKGFKIINKELAEDPEENPGGDPIDTGEGNKEPEDPDRDEDGNIIVWPGEPKEPEVPEEKPVEEPKEEPEVPEEKPVEEPKEEPEVPEEKPAEEIKEERELSEEKTAEKKEKVKDSLGIDENANKDEVKSENKLPKTGDNSIKMALLGIVLILSGYYIKKKRII